MFDAIVIIGLTDQVIRHLGREPESDPLAQQAFVKQYANDRRAATLRKKVDLLSEVTLEMRQRSTTGGVE